MCQQIQSYEHISDAFHILLSVEIVAFSIRRVVIIGHCEVVVVYISGRGLGM